MLSQTLAEKSPGPTPAPVPFPALLKALQVVWRDRHTRIARQTHAFVMSSVAMLACCRCTGSELRLTTVLTATHF